MSQDVWGFFVKFGSARYNHAVELLRVGKHFDAAPHLALVATSGQTDFRQARKLLIQVLTLLSRKRDPKMLAVELNVVIRRLSSTSWLKQADMECILCCDYFANPVTTPCGHMFCRSCLERTMDYKRRCPLCLHSLKRFNLSHISNTTFVEGALKSINAIPSSPFPETELIPIIVCTVGYPSISCPLLIFDARYCRMVRRVLQTGTRKFGIVATDTSKDYVDYGTVLEVRDCIQLADGSSILSTIGLSRFKVVERCIRDGYEVARVLPIVDEVPVETMEMWDMKVLGHQIITKALVWLSRLPESKIEAMENAFGSMPLDEDEDEWWNSTDGPAWLWWLVAVLPLRTQIKLLILSTDSLLKRMRAVCCTLEALDLHATA
uniref:RING-type domain-containing protein n=1 Tax=Heliothis virescens TaxID=7102 RepID=A0A2A4IWF8_HELVI